MQCVRNRTEQLVVNEVFNIHRDVSLLYVLWITGKSVPAQYEPWLLLPDLAASEQDHNKPKYIQMLYADNKTKV